MTRNIVLFMNHGLGKVMLTITENRLPSECSDAFVPPVTLEKVEQQLDAWFSHGVFSSEEQDRLRQEARTQYAELPETATL